MGVTVFTRKSTSALAVTSTDDPSVDPFAFIMAIEGYYEISFTEYSLHEFEKFLA
jgi:hypothetical protein